MKSYSTLEAANPVFVHLPQDQSADPIQISVPEDRYLPGVGSAGWTVPLELLLELLVGDIGKDCGRICRQADDLAEAAVGTLSAFTEVLMHDLDLGIF